jgi:DNA-directed RNA polymerase I, II, and III subunit RPABC2
VKYYIEYIINIYYIVGRICGVLQMPPKSSKLTKLVPKIEDEIDYTIEDEDEVLEIEDDEEMPELVKDEETKPDIIQKMFVLPKSQHRTSDVLSIYEKAEVISIRARQIEKGATPFVDAGDLTDPIQIAEKELIARRCPLSIIRNLNNSICEIKPVNELAIHPDAFNSLLKQ